MRIAVASDHAGFAFKQALIAELRQLGHEVVDFGTDSEASCDYPDFAIPAAQSVASGDCDRAILPCTNGIGMAMVANRIPGVRGALVYSERTAMMTRQHHDSNALCLGATTSYPCSQSLTNSGSNSGGSCKSTGKSIKTASPVAYFKLLKDERNTPKFRAFTTIFTTGSLAAMDFRISTVRSLDALSAKICSRL